MGIDLINNALRKKLWVALVAACVEMTSAVTAPRRVHMECDCPEPEVCRRCRKEGHVKDVCWSLSASTDAKKATAAPTVPNQGFAESAGSQATSGMTVPSLTSATTAERRFTRLPTAQSRPSARGCRLSRSNALRQGW